ncbi:hypothetical protein P3T76_008425 [Phytophthora citrophthora]|uniref:RxLR effector protein n=1 Tax=Phytophthora citrophthora TaxID=4793 RepID=A0AAD9LLJ9_9STRA|nr:hypothetical protein P3T76_008425 [Phytophthora citrophthora]
MKFTVFAFLLVNVLVAAQDPNTTGGQAGSMVSDPNAPTTTQPPPTPSPPPAVPAVNPAAPNTPVFGAPATPAPWTANLTPLIDGSGSTGSSLGSAGEIEAPTTRKPKRITDSSRSESTTPTPEDSSACTTSGAWFVAVLALGVSTML